MHNEFSLGIPHLNQFNHLAYKHATKECVFLWAPIYMKDNRHEAMVKWVDYGTVGQSQERDLLTHFMSTSSGAACWMWPHPLPYNPTRDDLASTRATLLDLTRTQLSATQVLNITLMWLHSMTEWIMWQSCLCTWNTVKREWAVQCKVTYAYCINLPAHNYIVYSSSCTCFEIPRKEHLCLN